MSNSFVVRKQKILEQLAVPEESYVDLSPKSSLDQPIIPLVDQINNTHGLVTTSSCSGRVSVFLEGNKKEAVGTIPKNDSNDPRGRAASLGGKGGGGSWLFVSHHPIEADISGSEDHFHSLFGLRSAANKEGHAVQGESERFVHFKFEPMITLASFIYVQSLSTEQPSVPLNAYIARAMFCVVHSQSLTMQDPQILHILTASLSHAQNVLSAALNSGFRESGAINLRSNKASSVNEPTPMVAVRTTGLAFDSIIAYQGADGSLVSIVGESHLRTLVSIANARFRGNSERMARFSAALARHSWETLPDSAQTRRR